MNADSSSGSTDSAEIIGWTGPTLGATIDADRVSAAATCLIVMLRGYLVFVGAGMSVTLAPTVVLQHAASPTGPETRHSPLAHRVRSEFLEMPGLCLTFKQACRLWALEERACGCVLQDLVAEGFLAVSARGHYVRPPTTGGGTGTPMNQPRRTAASRRH